MARRRNPAKRFLLLAVLLALVAALLVGTWYVASPWMALTSLRDAATDLDTAELEQRIDFPSVRASIRPQIRSRVARTLDRQADLGPFRELGQALARAASDRVIESAVTPEGLATIVTTGAVAAPVIGSAPQAIDWSVDRDGFDRFRATGQVAGRQTPTILHFTREGFGWRLVAVDLPL
ncbi:DUF2939 domain-containing protein [Altericroceibacterium xinjiangense]|uniref:DUF2939 domain-containing protein n=1 Tax=Altericroceibacterium xinjiangense TaxID=762261 RepID=UPI000F7E2FF6|nr:DUF2939 domain-containing protein [Altericroceibacterium xinjiangense]